MGKPSFTQTKIIIEFMESHRDLARGHLHHRGEGRKKREILWTQLAEKLNSVGGCIKDVSLWKKYWNDKKLNIRKNELKRRMSMQTGGGFQKFPEISPYDKRILDLMDEDCASRTPGITVDPCYTENAVIHQVEELQEENLLHDEQLQEAKLFIPYVEFDENQPETGVTVQLMKNEPDIVVKNNKDNTKNTNAKKRTTSGSSSEQSRVYYWSDPKELEDRRIEDEGRLSDGIINIGDYLMFNKETMNAQVLAAQAVVSAMKVLKDSAAAQVKLAKAQIKVAEAQATTARLQAKAAQTQAEVAQAQKKAIEGSCVCKK